jgi:hypothetical protein
MALCTPEPYGKIQPFVQTLQRLRLAQHHGHFSPLAHAVR